jgi:hypothetical protein
MGWHSEGIAASRRGPGKAHHVGVSTEEDQLGAKSTLGEAEGSIGCTETQAHNFSGGQKENCSGCTCTVGED